MGDVIAKKVGVGGTVGRFLGVGGVLILGGRGQRLTAAPESLVVPIEQSADGWLCELTLEKGLAADVRKATVATTRRRAADKCLDGCGRLNRAILCQSGVGRTGGPIFSIVRSDAKIISHFRQ